MKEIEAKILEVDVERIKSQLDSMNARRSFDGEMHAIYYDLPDNSLGKTKTALRLRREADTAVLAVKRKQAASPQGIKIADEVETTVSDFEATAQILGMLGYKVVLEMRKHRIQYELGNVHIVIDKYSGDHSHIPAFLEIEAPDVVSLHRMAQSLGFDASDLSGMNSAELLEHYQSKRHQP